MKYDLVETDDSRIINNKKVIVEVLGYSNLTEEEAIKKQLEDKGAYKWRKVPHDPNRPQEKILGSRESSSKLSRGELDELAKQAVEKYNKKEDLSQSEKEAYRLVTGKKIPVINKVKQVMTREDFNRIKEQEKQRQIIELKQKIKQEIEARKVGITGTGGTYNIPKSAIFSSGFESKLSKSNITGYEKASEIISKARKQTINYKDLPERSVISTDDGDILVSELEANQSLKPSVSYLGNVSRKVKQKFDNRPIPISENVLSESPFEKRVRKTIEHEEAARKRAINARKVLGLDFLNIKEDDTDSKKFFKYLGNVGYYSSGLGAAEFAETLIITGRKGAAVTEGTIKNTSQTFKELKRAKNEVLSTTLNPKTPEGKATYATALIGGIIPATKAALNARKTNINIDYTGNKDIIAGVVKPNSKLKGKDISGAFVITDAKKGYGRGQFKLGKNKIIIKTISESGINIKIKNLKFKKNNVYSKTLSNRQIKTISNPIDSKITRQTSDFKRLFEIHDRGTDVSAFGSKEVINTEFGGISFNVKGKQKITSELKGIQTTKIGQQVIATKKIVASERANISADLTKNSEIKLKFENREKELKYISPKFVYEKTKTEPDMRYFSIEKEGAIGAFIRESRATTKKAQIDIIKADYSYIEKPIKLGKKAQIQIGESQSSKYKPTEIKIEKGKTTIPQLNINFMENISNAIRFKPYSSLIANPIYYTKQDTKINSRFKSRSKIYSKSKISQKSDINIKNASKVNISPKVNVKPFSNVKSKLDYKSEITFKTKLTTSSQIGIEPIRPIKINPPYINTKLTSITIAPPPTKNKNFTFKNLYAKNKKVKSDKRLFKYTPSFYSLTFNIKQKKPKKKIQGLTGLEIRPIFTT